MILAFEAEKGMILPANEFLAWVHNAIPACHRWVRVLSLAIASYQAESKFRSDELELYYFTSLPTS